MRLLLGLKKNLNLFKEKFTGSYIILGPLDILAFNRNCSSFYFIDILVLKSLYDYVHSLML